jgi:hypothetical protein
MQKVCCTQERLILREMICFLLIHICSLGVSPRTLLHYQLYLQFRGMCLIPTLCSSPWWWWLCNISVEILPWFYQLNLLRYVIVSMFDVHWGKHLFSKKCWDHFT